MINKYPLWCIHSEDQVIGDRIINICEISVKPTTDNNWTVLYKPNSLLDAQFYIKRLKDLYDMDIKKFLVGQEPSMFVYADQVYKCTYVFPEQSCICGNEIPGNTAYGEYNPGGLKIDYLQSHVFFYYENECLVKGNKVFLNGELILNPKELSELCEKIGQQFNQLDTHPEKLIKWLNDNYSNINSYECNGYCCLNISNKEDS